MWRAHAVCTNQHWRGKGNFKGTWVAVPAFSSNYTPSFSWSQVFLFSSEPPLLFLIGPVSPTLILIGLCWRYQLFAGLWGCVLHVRSWLLP